MDTSCADIIDLSCVVLPERVLHSKIPVDGIRVLDLGRNPICGRGYCRGLVQHCYATAAGAGKATGCEEPGRQRARIHIACGSDLRWHLKCTDVVVQGVPG